MKKNNSKKSINKSVFFFGVALLFGTWILSFFVIYTDFNIEVDHALMETKRLSIVLERHIFGAVSQIEDSLFSLRQNWESGIKPNEMNYLLDYFVSSRRDLFNLITVIKADGYVLVTNQKSTKPTYSGDRPFFIYHKDNSDRKIHIEPPILGRVTGKWYIPVSMRLNDKNGEFMGTLLASVNPYYFSTIFNEVNLGDQSIIYLS
ncbi:MAG TPA: hypothetical protein PLO89_07585, partial [Spirochaetota bacterium]|nr:hypothetical protein [Spirochaetota bacterium]